MLDGCVHGFAGVNDVYRERLLDAFQWLILRELVKATQTFFFSYMNIVKSYMASGQTTCFCQPNNNINKYIRRDHQQK